MMNNRMFPTELVYTPLFKSDVKRLRQKFRSIQADLTPFIDILKVSDSIRARIPNVGAYIAVTVRVRNSNLNKGMSSGYRLIYYKPVHDKVVLLTIYAKSEQTDIRAHEIRKLVTRLE